MHDEYFINNITGEILTATAAIKRYYTEEKHGYKDAWTDEWTATGIDAPELLAPPDFTKAVKV